MFGGVQTSLHFSENSSVPIDSELRLNLLPEREGKRGMGNQDSVQR